MRAILITFIFSLCLLTSKAQIQNPNFEQWNIVGTDTLLIDWKQSSFGVSQNSNAISGQYSVTMWNWYYYSKGFISNNLSQNLPIPGNFEDVGGAPINFRPSAISGKYKYELGQNQGVADSAIIMISMRKRNITGAIDTIAFDVISLPPAANPTVFSFPLNYFSAATPDTFVISILSSRDGFCNVTGNGNCLYLTIDDLAFSSSTNLNEVRNESISIYPNPATRYFNIQLPKSFNGESATITLVDLTGKIVFNEIFKTSFPSFQIPDKFNVGLYILKVQSNNSTFYSKLLVDH